MVSACALRTIREGAGKIRALTNSLSSTDRWVATDASPIVARALKSADAICRGVTLRDKIFSTSLG